MESIKTLNDLHTEEMKTMVEFEGNAKGALQELCINIKLQKDEFPIYSLTNETGPAHCRQFTAECRVAGLSASAISNRRKQAEKMAAAKVLLQMQHLAPVSDRAKSSLMNILLYDKVDNLIVQVEQACEKNGLNWQRLTLSDFTSDCYTINDKTLMHIFEISNTDASGWTRLTKALQLSAAERHFHLCYQLGDNVMYLKKRFSMLNFSQGADCPRAYKVYLRQQSELVINIGIDNVYHVKCNSDENEFSYTYLNNALCNFRDDHCNKVQCVNIYLENIYDGMDMNFISLRSVIYNIFAQSNFAVHLVDSRMMNSSSGKV